MVTHNDAGVLKLRANLQRAGGWLLHALSAGEFSQKPSGPTPFVLVSLLFPCIAEGKPDIPNMKIFHILQGNLLVPEIVSRIWDSAQATKNSSQGPPWKACTISVPGGLPPNELPAPASTLNDHELRSSC